MPEGTFYARLAPGDTPADPSGRVRRRHTPVYPTDEALRDDGEWHPTDTLERAEVGDLGGETLVEITPAEAGAVEERWWSVAAERREVLAAQGRGAFGLRLASQSHGDADARLTGAERVLVAEYLAGAPVVVSAWGPDADPLHVRTDGHWVWSERLAGGVRRDGSPPEPAFLAHIRARRYRWPAVAADVTDAAARLVDS